MEIKQALMSLIKKEDLAEEIATLCFENLFSGEMSPSQAGGFLMGLKVKGETSIEVFSAVKTALKYARQIDINDICDKSIDTCGTGGDGKMSFNCSTAVAIFLADMGYKVVKHGNRAISSKCGSADVINALGLPIAKEVTEIKGLLEKNNFAFIFAPYFHPAFAKIAPIRMELGVPTIFNIMGPLLNPANPTHQLVGVGDPRYLELVANVLKMKKIKKGAVVHGDGYDEITPTGETKAILIEHENLKHITIIPEEFGIKRCSYEDLRCDSLEASLNIMKALFSGKGPEAIKDMVSLNLGMAIYLLEDNLSLKDAVKMAKNKINRGLNGRGILC